MSNVGTICPSSSRGQSQARTSLRERSGVIFPEDVDKNLANLEPRSGPSGNRDGRQRVKVQSLRPSTQPKRGGANREAITAPVLRDGSEMPRHAPEALDLLFKLGVVTGEQMAGLLAGSSGARISAYRVGEILRALGAGGVERRGRRGDRKTPDGSARRADKPQNRPSGTPLVARVRRPFGYEKDCEPARLRTLYYLTGEGLSYVARKRDLYPTVAESLYKRVLEEARVDHALLRNEFYRRVCEELAPGPYADGPGPRLETMWAEAGMTPIRLNDVEGRGRRYLNPDGLLEIEYANIGRSTASAAPGGRSALLKLYVESDTGTEDMSWQVAGHADKYAEHLLGVLDRETDEPGESDLRGVELPRVLFVSPGPKRTHWVRRVVRENALDERSVFNGVRDVFHERGLSLPALFWFTNLRWLHEEGSRGKSYWALSGKVLDNLV